MLVPETKAAYPGGDRMETAWAEASEIASAVGAGRASATDIVTAALARIGELNPAYGGHMRPRLQLIRSERSYIARCAKFDVFFALSI